ncbi:hypothetical protein E3226_005945 [Legionella geestiana]|uniref:hypothetical protein n=1 Tax=Legionella geestiana TaxID=45065 RepID=UPI001091EE13|nr:hypothetical protein [Legionella geestiana]QDQ39970.1 hypothetical protein E3226_005945 [Legionella geestiana]
MLKFFNASSLMDTPEERFSECRQMEPSRTAGVFPIKISPCYLFKAFDKLEYNGLQVILNLVAIGSAVLTLLLAAWIVSKCQNNQNTEENQAEPLAISLSGT